MKRKKHSLTNVKMARRSPLGRGKSVGGMSSVVSRRHGWADGRVFDDMRITAWEGRADPLQTTSVLPSQSYLSRLLPSLTGQWLNNVHPLDKARARRHFKEISKLHLPAFIDYRLIGRTGSIVWVRHSVVDLSVKDGAIILRGYVVDIQTEKEYQLESLRVSEREQNRIGQDLHDDLCQVLAGVSCLMRVAEGRIASKLPEEVEYLRELNQQIIDAMHRTRALTHGLFPGSVQIADIRGALLELATQIRARFKVSLDTRFVGRFRKHTPAQIIQIYRITQEATTNAIKHGQATTIAVLLESVKSGMRLTIQDNGIGLTKPDPATSGVGMHIMQYRAGILGGELVIANSRSGGVVVTLEYPFEQDHVLNAK